MISVAKSKLADAESGRQSSLVTFWSSIMLIGVMFASVTVIAVLSEGEKFKEKCFTIAIAITMVVTLFLIVPFAKAFFEYPSPDNAPFCRKMVLMLEIASIS